jgi:hypothetical protein
MAYLHEFHGLSGGWYEELWRPATAQVCFGSTIKPSYRPFRRYGVHLENRRRKKYLEALARSLAPALGGQQEATAVIETSLEERFREQSDKWARETGHLSSPAQKMLHPSYQAILGMAGDQKEEVIRLLLRDMEKNRRGWFLALSYLAQDNPIKQADAGKIDKMIAAWVSWGKEKRLL